MKSMNLNKNRHAELDSASLNKRFRNKFGMAIFILLLFSLSSCSNVFDKKLDEEKSSDKNTYIMIVPDGINIKDRSIEPIIEDALGKMQNINLYATKTEDSEGNSVSGTKNRLPNDNISTGSLSTLYNQLLLLKDGAGKYTFDISGSIDGVYFYQRLENQIIEESKTNLIEFNNLIPMKDSNSSKFTPDYEQFGNFGGIDIKLNFDNPRYMYKKVIVTLNDLSKSPDDEDYVAYSGELDISSQTSVRYRRSLTSDSEYISASLGVISTGHIATGEYRITFDFYCKEITTTTKTGTNSVLTKENQKVNSLSYVVRVARGLNSIFEDTIDLNEVYTITYEDCHGSYSCGLSDGQVKVDSYTRKSQNIILPRYYRAYGIFEGWYTQPTGGDLVTNIPTGSSGNITLYAHWRELGTSGTPAVLYVDPTSTYPYGIDEGHALPSISEAVKFIGESMGNYHPWTLKIKGPLTENINIADNYGFNTYATSLTLEGIRGLDENNIPQDEIKGRFTEAGENGATLAVNTKVPVIIKNLKITGGNNSNTGNIKGGGIYVGSYTYSNTTTPASVTLDDGALITGNTVPSGSGNGIYCDGTLKIKGSAVVEDDIYLAAGKKLIISGPLTSTATTIATITPAEYTPGTVILEAASGSEVTLDSALVGKFSVSDAEGREWGINTEGQLVKKPIVTFNSNGGTAITSQTITYGSTATEPAAPTKSAFEFKGWFTDENLTEPFSFSTPITSDITLYAKFNPVIGSILMTDGTFKSSSEITSENVSNIVGIVFELDGTAAPKFVLGIIHSPVSSRLMWASTSTLRDIRFDAIICNSSKTGKGAAATAVFEGDTDGSDNWAEIQRVDPTNYIESNFPAFQFANNYATTASLTGTYSEGWYLPSIAELSSVYKSIDIMNTVLEAINTNSGTEIATKYFSEEEQDGYWSSSQRPNDQDMTWDVWMADGFINTNLQKTLDRLVCCIRTAKPLPDYTVRFITNGGSEIPLQKVESGQKASVPENPTKEGSNFAGWYTSTDGGTTLSETVFDFESTTITYHTFLYAKWE